MANAGPVVSKVQRSTRTRRTIKQLERLNIPYDDIIFGLVHGRRIVINDYARTNPFKSCDAINIKRNSDDLKEMLEESIGFDIGI